jgi:hypothetical protein
MKKKIFVLLTIIQAFTFMFGQKPILYIHIVSHNEPTDNLDVSPGLNYFKAKENALEFAKIIDAKNVKWNLQTSDGFVIGALDFDNAGTSKTDVFEQLSSFPYDDNIEIDPRSKNKSGRNIADQWYLLDSCGAKPSKTLGGFIYAVCPPAQESSIDWFKYREPIIGNIYKNSWKCEILSGAGSLTPHCNDLNDFGIFKPLSVNDFYTHDTSISNNLWCMGVGCAPVLDSLSDEQEIIDLIKGQVDSIQKGIWPSDKFYVTRIMTNQREFGPLLFQKIKKVLDSLQLISDTQLKWATIGETMEAFKKWQNGDNQKCSQWLCGEKTSSIKEETKTGNIYAYPNPASSYIYFSEKIRDFKMYDLHGNVIMEKQNTLEVDLQNISNGIYILNTDNSYQKMILNK